MSAQELKLLAEDIRKNGQVEAITMLTGLILDGRCRWEACEIIGIEPRTVEFIGTDPIAFVLSKNERRRHLPLVQRALIAEALATLAHGSNQFGKMKKEEVENSTSSFSRYDAAKAMNISIGSLHDARTLRAHGEPHIVEMVRTGQVPLQATSRIVTNTPRVVQQTWQKPEQVQEVVRKYKTLKKPAKKPPGKSGMINPPYRGLKPIRTEDLGLPPEDASFAERNAHIEKYGKVQLRPKLVQDMINHRDMVGGLIAPILSIANEHQPDAPTFLAAIDELLAWKPKKGESNGWATDFAANGREYLRLLDQKLDAALTLLGALRELLAARSHAAE